MNYTVDLISQELACKLKVNVIVIQHRGRTLTSIAVVDLLSRFLVLSLLANSCCILGSVISSGKLKQKKKTSTFAAFYSDWLLISVYKEVG